MRKEVVREELLQTLEAIQPGLSPKEIIEQSSCFVFKDGQAMTYNDEIACSHETSLDFTGAIPAKPLLDLLRKLKDDKLTFEIKEGEIVINGKNKASGIRMEHEVILPYDKVEKPTEWRALHEDFSEAVNLVHQCTGKDQSQFATTCVHLTPKWLESCDNYKLMRFKLPTGIKAKYLVKGDSIKSMVGLDMTEMCESDSWVHFKNPAGLVLSCRRSIGEDFRDLTPLLVPEGEKTNFPKGLAAAAELAQVFSAENADNNQVNVKLQSDGKLQIRGDGASGWYKEYKKINYRGPTMRFVVGPALLIELVDKYSECFVAANRLTVVAGKFTWVASLEEAASDA